MKTEVTPEQFDQAITLLATICATAPVPEGTKATLWQWVDANRSALNIVVGLARETFEAKVAADLEATGPDLDESYELVDVGTNGEAS